jgi:Fe-S-cluster containining protein
MSLCDRCYAPGYCCRRFQLFVNHGDEKTFWIADGLGAVHDWLRENNLPFLPLRINEVVHDRKTDLDYASWFYTCPALKSDGRCGRYERRPELCRSFEAGGDSALCVHANLVTEAGDPSVNISMI